MRSVLSLLLVATVAVSAFPSTEAAAGFQPWTDEPTSPEAGPVKQYLPMIAVGAGGWSQRSFRISIDPTAHIRYGLTYPVTYRFRIPAASSALKAYRRFTPSQPWARITEEAAGDFFNGIEAVRFDYADSRAYVSVAFGSTGDDILLKMTDANGHIVPAEFETIMAFYDDRQAAVVVDADDAKDSFQEEVRAAMQAFTEAQLWLTVGIITGGISDAMWADIQGAIDAGYVEPSCHTRTHPHTPYADYDSEVGGCSIDIKSHLKVPYPKGTSEYVVAYMDSYGDSDATLRSTLAQYNYLVERSTVQGMDGYARWSETDGLYERVGISIFADNYTVETLNTRFDSVLANRGIYHVYFHPWAYNWAGQNPIRAHVDHIKGRSNVWYVGSGHLYMYHYVQERGKVVVTTVD